jgi:hypothetical protein
VGELKDELSKQIEKEFNESTFCGELFSINIDLGSTYCDYYKICIEGLMEFETIDGYRLQKLLGTSKRYSKEELEMPHIRQHIIENLDRTLQDLIKKTKLETVKNFPHMKSITFRCWKRSNYF